MGIIIEGIIFWVLVAIFLKLIFKSIDLFIDYLHSPNLSQIVAPIINNIKITFKKTILFTKVQINKFNQDKYLGRRNLIKMFVAFNVLVFIAYFPVYFKYFQQDEWFYMAYYKPILYSPLGAFQSFILPFQDPQTFSFHLTPLGSFFQWFEYYFFRFNFLPYMILSTLLHSVNSLLVLIFTFKLTKNKFISLIAGFFFALTASHYEAVSWAGAHINTEGALLFGLLSLIMLLNFFETAKKNQYYYFLLFFVLSLLTKETTISLILFVPLLVLILKGKRYLKKLKLFYLISIIYLSLRIFLPKILVSIVGGQAISSISGKNYDVMFSGYYFIALTLKSLAQIFFAGVPFSKISETITDLGYPQYNAQKAVKGIDYLTFTQSAGLDIVLYFFAFIALLILTAIVVYFNFKDKKSVTPLYIALLYIFLSIIPLTFLAGWLLTFFTYIASLESRQLYTITVGAGIIFAYFIYIIAKNFKAKYASIIIVSFLLFWGVVQVINIHKNVNKYNITANDRKDIVNLWLEERPKLTNKNVFYSESNVALYGFAEYMLPFQNNPGQVLLSIYGYDKSIPNEFLSRKFLIKGLTEEWYSEFEGVGIGYFLNKKHLLQAAAKYNFQPNDIIGVKYDGTNQRVSSITQQTRQEVKDYLDKREKKKNWKFYQDEKINYSFFFPAEYSLQSNFTPNENIISSIGITKKDKPLPLLVINIYKKPDGLGVSNFASELDNGIGQKIGENYTFSSLRLGPTDQFTAVYAKNYLYDMYLFNTISNTEVKQLILPSSTQLSEEDRIMIVEILELMEFNN